MKLKFQLRDLFRFSPFIVTLWWVVVILTVWYFKWLGIGLLEFKSHDLRFQFRGNLPPDERIVYLSIDETSTFDHVDATLLRNVPLANYLKSFPYPRRIWAHVIEKLAESGARAIVFDLLFLTESNDEDDRALKNAITKYHDKVVIGANFGEHQIPGVEGPTQKVCMKPSPNILPEAKSLASEVVGYVNYPVDYRLQLEDQAIRFMCPVGWPFTIDDDSIPLYSIDALGVKKAFPEINLPAKNVPVGIDYLGPGYQVDKYAYPLYLIFDRKTWESDIPPFHQGKFFKDKIVLIGPRANYLHDEHLTPSGKMYGADIHLYAITTLLKQKSIHFTTEWMNIFILATLGLLYAFVIPLTKSPLIKLVPAFGFGLSYFVIAQVAFQRFQLFIPVVPVEILFIGSTASVVTFQAFFEQLEKRRVSGMLQRYVSKNVADQLIKSGASVDSLLTPQMKTVTVLFSDVRDFTTMTENSEPGPFVHQLNEYLTAMVECVFNNKGTLDKFVGDAVMAVFGNPTTLGNSEDAYCAVKTAVEMRESLKKLNQRWEKDGKATFRIGIGLNYGDVMAGDIGSNQKKEFGVIGDPVNVAARVESLTKDQKTDILITDTVYELVKDRVEVEPRGDLKVKGRGKAVHIFALLGLRTKSV